MNKKTIPIFISLFIERMVFNKSTGIYQNIRLKYHNTQVKHL